MQNHQKFRHHLVLEPKCANVTTIGDYCLRLMIFMQTFCLGAWQAITHKHVVWELGKSYSANIFYSGPNIVLCYSCFVFVVFDICIYIYIIIYIYISISISIYIYIHIYIYIYIYVVCPCAASVLGKCF